MSLSLSPLDERLEAAGARFTDFAGWRMPLRFTSELAEHKAVREAAGVFDLSHMAEILVTGPHAAAAMDHALAGLFSPLVDGQARYSLLLSPDGGILDDLIVYRTAPDRFLVVANASNRDVVRDELRSRCRGADCEVDDVTDELALVAVQGPRSREVLERVADLEVDGLKTLRYYRALPMRFAGSDGLVARTGYTGEDGFELSLEASAAPALWDAVLAAGADLGAVPAGLAARDTLRLEAGMPLYGNELTGQVHPAQAGLSRSVPVARKGEFVGREAVLAGPPAGARHLVGLVGEGRRAPRAGTAILDGDTVVGEVTSGALSPTLGHPIALAYVDPALTDPGLPLEADVRGTRVPVTVSTLPFYSRKES